MPPPDLHRHPKGHGYQSLTHHASSARWARRWSSDPHRADARGGREGIAAHWILPGARAPAPTRDAQRLGAMWLRACSTSRTRRASASGFLGTRQDRPVPRLDLRLHAQVRAIPSPRAPRQWTSPGRSTPTSATPCVAAKVNNDRWRCAPSCQQSGDVVVRSSAAPNAPAEPGLAQLRAHRARALKIRHCLKTMEQEVAGPGRRCSRRRAEGLHRCRQSATENAALWQQVTPGQPQIRAELLTDIGLLGRRSPASSPSASRLFAEDGQRPDALTLTLGRYASDENAAAGHGADRRQRRRLGAARACCAIPGDAIVGYLGRSEGLTVPAPPTAASASACSGATASAGPTVEWAEQPVRPF